MLCELYQADERLKYQHQRPSNEDHGIVIGEPLNMTYDDTVKATSGDHIVVALYRKPEDMTDVNYVCGFGMNPQNKPYLGIPARGIFTMPSNYVPCLTGSHAPSATCILGPRSGGGKTVAGISTYTTDCKGMAFNSSGSQLIYDMACSWDQGYQEPAGWQKTEFDYELKLKITFQNTQDKSYKTYNTQISSVAGNQGAIETIPPLYLMYGCLAADTKVTMADGALKRICEVNIGDEALGIDHAPWRVSNVWRGKEDKPMFRLVAADRTLVLTHNHPLVTREGIKTAGRLQPGMKVLLDNGEYAELTRVELIAYYGEVYNLTLQRSGAEAPEQHLMLADGFVVGDNVLQNHKEELIKEELRKEELLKEELRKEALLWVR